MSGRPSDVVDHTIRHAQRLLTGSAYGWSTAREALVRILAYLEMRAPDDPSLERLRRFIAERDQASASRSGDPEQR